MCFLDKAQGSTLWSAAWGATWGQVSRVPYLVMNGVGFAQPLDIQVGLVVGPTMDIPMFSSGNMSYKHLH